MRDWYELEECYLTERGRALIAELASLGLDQKLATELAHELMLSEELYELEDDHG